MCKYQLLIGSNDSMLATIAQLMTKNSRLLTNENYQNLTDDFTGTVYTSLADLSRERIIETAQKAVAVHYFPSEVWTSIEHLEHTEELLVDLVKTHKLKVKNFSPKIDPTNSLAQADQRIQDSPQLWVVGCSFAHGFGLLSDDCRYINLISKKFHIPYSDLTSPGSSISWAADQILRADIRSGDIVVWGLTGTNRIDYYINNQYIPVVGGVELKKLRQPLGKKINKFFDWLMLDDNRVNQSIKSIYQVINFIKKINANLIILNHCSDLSLYEHSSIINRHYLSDFDFVITPKEFIDFTDDGHPGPATNHLWADQIIDFIDRNGIAPSGDGH